MSPASSSYSQTRWWWRSAGCEQPPPGSCAGPQSASSGSESSGSGACGTPPASWPPAERAAGWRCPADSGGCCSPASKQPVVQPEICAHSTKCYAYLVVS